MSQIKAGAVLSYVYILITILVALLYTPIMIRQLGQSEYGLYAMIGSLSAYFSIMDLGLGNAVIRYNARNRVTGDKESESKLNGMFLILYLIIGILTVIVGMIVYYSIDKLFAQNLSLVQLQKVRLMVIILIVNFSVSMPLSVFGSIMQSYEKFAIVKTINIIRSIMTPALTLPLLFIGYGSVAMVSISTFVNIGTLLFNVYYCLRVLKLKFKFNQFDFSLLKEILGYSFFIFLGVIVDQLNWSTGQIILGVVSGTVAVAIYAIAMQFIRLYMQFSTSISGVFLPRVSMMVANKATNLELSNLVIKFGRLQYIVMAYILSGFTLFGKQFIVMWAGKEYEKAYLMALLIMIPFTIDLIQNICLSILQAKNFQKFRSVVLIIIAIFIVILSFCLGKRYGGLGVAFATGFSYFLGAGIVMNVYYHERLGLDIPRFWKNIGSISIPVIISSMVSVGTQIVFPHKNMIFFLLQILLFSVAYMFLMWKMGCNEYEKDLISRIMKKVKIKLFK